MAIPRRIVRNTAPRALSAERPYCMKHPAQINPVANSTMGY
jgi:hypothetical protein